MTVRAKGGSAVMAQRSEPPDALDFFPTPPWATRALLHHVIPWAAGSVWEPACGERHMADVLCEQFAAVAASDVHDYGGNQRVGSFTGCGLDVLEAPFAAGTDWIITNPPFNLAVEFAERALTETRVGVALLVRTNWLEGIERYERLFRDSPPAIVAPFVERVPMVKGRWDPDASTATSYAWFVWCFGAPGGRLAERESPGAKLKWIPPGCRDRLTLSDDRRRFAAWSLPATDLFDEVTA